MSVRPRALLGLLIALAFVGLPLIQAAVGVYIDWLWFLDVGQGAVFWTRLASWSVVGLAFGLAAFAILYGNLKTARVLAPRAMPIGPPFEVPEQVAQFVTELRSRFSPWLDRLVLWGSVFFGITSGAAMAAQWQTFRLAAAAEPFGYADPQFGRDVGFFVFTLPALRAMGDWLTGVLVLTTVLTLFVHVIDGAIQPFQRLRGFAPHVKAHLSVLAAAIVLSLGFNYWLDIYELSYSLRGQVAGASYTDVHAQLPAYRILIVISIVTAAVLLVNIRVKGWRLPLIALGVWLAASVVFGSIWPAVVQQFVVTPNEVRLERPYIKRNIEYTRRAFGLADVRGRAFPAAEDLKAEDIIANRTTLGNVRLWDPTIVAESYRQLQAIRPYYDFPDVDVDRYVIDGRRRQVLVAAREMNIEKLPEQAKTWVNEHLVYTHGFGLVISPANAADSRGLPQFIVGDVPPRTDTDLVTREGRIYFGEDTDDYVIVNTGLPEFDYPRGERNAEYTYKGDSGIEIGSILRRVAWALRLGSSQVLFSAYVRPDSRVLLHRDIWERVDKMAPWLRLEDDAYPALVDGRIIWIIDGYTSSDHYPYSQPFDTGESYLRNSVKVTVDAFTGETKLYAFDPEDPVLAAWRAIFPGLITDGDQIPDEIRAHFRYPQRLFEAQATVYETYHMTDPRVFYNKEDAWAVPGERQGNPMEPFFVLMQLPGQPAEDFYIMQPFTPRNRDNMIGWMAAASDPDRYGERTVYQFPKERVVLGPEQVRSRINADPAISPQLSLWNQRGSQVLFGNMLVIPIEDSIVYVMPLYLQAQQTALPELTRVIVVYADKVAMERSLEAALLTVFGGRTPPPSEPATGTGGAASATAQQAQRLYERAIEAQRQGDWAEYGRLIEELGRVLGRLAGAETSVPAK